MEELTVFNTNKSILMDSKEIAELTGKRHSDVMRDIRNQLDQQNINQRTFASVYMDKKNEQRNCFSLDYEQTMILISGYSIPLRAKIITRWTELEQKNKPRLPQSYSEALRELATKVEQNEQLKLEVETNKPKVEFFDTVTKSDSWLTFKEVANMLAIPELGRNNLMKRLYELGYLTKFRKPYQKHIDQKLFKVIESETSTGRINTSTVVSQKGVDRIIKVLK